MAQKKTIYYARTYRRIHTNVVYAVVYTALAVIPTLILLILCLKPITYNLSKLTQRLLTNALPAKKFSIIASNFPPFGTTYYLGFESRLPSPNELLINLLVVVVIVSFLVMSSMRGRPLMVYLLFSFMIHIISCVYFIFEDDYFVYTASIFSDIFMKQQISIWILFIVMMGAVTGFIGSSGLIYKIGAFLGVLVYSTVFGIIRYIVFMFILAYSSVLYMADMFFVTGPIFDFLYLVGIYTIYSDKMQKRFDSPEGEEEWAWL